MFWTICLFVFLEVRFRIRVLSNLHKSQCLRMCLPKERPVILDQKVKFCYDIV